MLSTHIFAKKESSAGMQQLFERTCKELRSVLISVPRGVPARLLLTDFQLLLGHELPFRELGYQTPQDFISSIPDVVRVVVPAAEGGDPVCFAVPDASTSQIARFVATQGKRKSKNSVALPSVTSPQVYAGFTDKSKFLGPSSVRARKKRKKRKKKRKSMS